jgi:hypothetical protein
MISSWDIISGMYGMPPKIAINAIPHLSFLSYACTVPAMRKLRNVQKMLH